MYADEKKSPASTPATDRHTVKVYERILDLLEAEGVRAVFGIPDPNFVHLFVARGTIDIENAGHLDEGDAVRFTATGAKHSRPSAIPSHDPVDVRGRR